MIQKLITKIQKTNAPIVVGLDPMLGYIPEHITKAAYAEYGETPEGAAEAVWQYNKGIVDAVCDLIPAVKPQVAMYEQFGLPGMAAFQKTVDYCKEKGSDRHRRCEAGRYRFYIGSLCRCASGNRADRQPELSCF